MWQWWTLRKLRSSDYDTSSAAFRKAVESRDLDVLLVVAGDTDENIRWAAVRALTQLNDPRSAPVLIERLKDPHLNIRELAVQGLAALGDPRAPQALLEVLARDNHQQVRRAALEGLATCGGAPVVPGAMQLAETGDTASRQLAIELLGRLGDPRATSSLLKNLEHPDQNLQWNAVTALGSIRDARAVDPLLSKMKSEDGGFFEEIVQTLGKIGDPRAVPAVRRLLENPRKRVREVAEEALQGMGWRPGDDAERTLVAIARQDWSAVEKLGLRAIPHLLVRILDVDSEIASAAKTVVTKLGWQPSSAVERARWAVADHQFTLALDQGAAALGPLMDAFRSQTYHTVAEAARALATLLERHAAALPVDELEPIASLKDGWGLEPHIVYNSSCDETGHTQWASRDVSAAPIRQLARQELIRRGVSS